MFALAEGLKRGEERAFEQLYREYADGVFHVGLRVLGDAALAQDVLQEVFIVVFRRIETWRGEGSLKAWLYQITVRCALRAKRRRPFTIDSENEAEASPPAVRDPPPAEMDFRAAVSREIDRLPTRARMVFVMFVVEGSPIRRSRASSRSTRGPRSRSSITPAPAEAPPREVRT